MEAKFSFVLICFVSCVRSSLSMGMCQLQGGPLQPFRDLYFSVLPERLPQQPGLHVDPPSPHGLYHSDNI